MHRILIVKVTSLGDIIEAQPVASDLRRAFPMATIDWAADAAFADVILWNSNVDRVHCAPLRQFKRSPSWASCRRIVTGLRELRAHRYDAIVDIHGAYKSAIIAFLARSKRKIGYVDGDLGEKGAAFAYTERFAPRGAETAWGAMRESVARALNYSYETLPNHNLKIPRPSIDDFPIALEGRIALLFHATSSPVKKWATERWAEVGRHLIAEGYRVLLPWGSADEYGEATRIAALAPGSQCLPSLTLLQVAQLIDAAALVVGTDTGLVHLAHALRKPTVMIFTATSREHFGISAPGQSISVGDQSQPPTASAVLCAIEEVSGSVQRDSRNPEALVVDSISSIADIA